MSELRQRKNIIKLVQELDAFPKVDKCYQEPTATGGGLSIMVFLLIGILVLTELNYYRKKSMLYEYDVDPIHDGKIKLNIDIIVAMKCRDLGADILDLTGQTTESFGMLKEEDVNFTFSHKQASFFSSMARINTYFRDEYHAVHNFVWNYQYSSFSQFPENEEVKKDNTDGCRFKGTLEVNKLAGNFHITAGKSIPVFPRGHAHLNIFLDETAFNFSHRILEFSFGERSQGIINPLDYEEKITTYANHIFQYFIQIVPTKIKKNFITRETYQYALTEQNRSISHEKGSHGMAGIFVKYDISPIRVHVTETFRPFLQLIIRLCGIVGGIFATSGLLHHYVQSLINFLCCHDVYNGKTITADKINRKSESDDLLNKTNNKQSMNSSLLFNYIPLEDDLIKPIEVNSLSNLHTNDNTNHLPLLLPPISTFNKDKNVGEVHNEVLNGNVIANGSKINFTNNYSNFTQVNLDDNSLNQVTFKTL